MVEQLNAMARLWWDWSAAMFWQVGLLILLIGCIDLIIRRWAWPQLRYALWSLILVKLLLPPALSLPSAIIPGLQPLVGQAIRWMVPERPVAGDSLGAISDCGLWIADFGRVAPPNSFDGAGSPEVWAFADPRATEFARATQPRSVTMMDSALAPDPQPAIVNHVIPDPDPGPQLAWQSYAMMIWLAGTVILGIWLFLRLHSLAGRHAYQAAAASLPQSFYSQLAGCAKHLGLRRIPGVVVTKRLASPAVFGVFRPVLLMPKGYLSKLSRRDTEHMLLHELAHVKRGDLVTHGLYMLLQIAYWYNPLLWLVRRQVHHLRELSCDATVAELLRERTAAYRRTLLETARRLLATSVEPGLGLLGLFEDSNRLLVRLRWLEKPTWRYRTMKRFTVATIAALMFICVLPMAQAQESAANEAEPVVVGEEDQQSRDQLSEDIASLQARLEQLMAQQKELQKQLRALDARRYQANGRQESLPRRDVTRREPRVPRSSSDLRVAPPEPFDGPSGGERLPAEAREQVRHAQEQIRHAQEQAKQAMKNAEKAREAAKADAEIQHAGAQEQEQWERQMEAWGERLEQWADGAEMQKWGRDMEKWGEQMARWGQEIGRRHVEVGNRSTGDAEASQMPAMPPMPPMPAMPALPPGSAHGQADVTVPAIPHPTPVPHAGGGRAPHVVIPEIHLPHVEMPRITPPVPPTIPGRQEGQEEAVSRTEHEVDLAPGRLLEVKNDMGSITVRGGDGPGCRLIVTIKGRAATMEEAQRIVDQTKVVITPSQDGVHVAMTKPEKETQREHAHRVVTMELVVPREARIKLSQAFGDIRLSHLDGSVKAVSNMGSIWASDVRGQVTLESNFGAIDFIVPRDFSAQVQAKSQMGTIQSDLPLDVAKSEGFSMGSKVSGTIGTGEGDVSLTTNMGSIRIRKQATESEQTF